MRKARKTPRRRKTSGQGPTRFVFRGVEYWVVTSDLSSLPPGLTPAEEQVLSLLRAGLTYEQIASRRGRSRHTVAKQVTSVLCKLKVGSRRELKLLR